MDLAPVMVQEKPAPVLASEPQHHAAYVAQKPATASAPATRDESPQDDDYDDSASFLEDILDNHEVSEDAADCPDSCTADEAREYRRRLHEVGAGQFVFETITSGNITARKLLTAFHMRIPPRLWEGEPDERHYQLLGLAINRELNKRRRLPQYSTIADAARLLQERKNIMVITGAGISTSLGIPDFRSKNTGFYSKLQNAGYEEPEEVFTLSNFDENPENFYKLAGDILPDLKRWSPTHQFIRLLQDKGKLLTNYTQNIDNIESHAGIHADKLIQCHGSWATASCRKCKYRIPGEDLFQNIREHEPAECKKCIAEIKEAKPRKRKRRSPNGAKRRRGPGEDDSDSDGAYDIPEPGIMKPDITFFGESLPSTFFDRLKEQDRDKVDLVVVMGTSMKVAPVSEIPNFLPSDVPQIYISRDPVHHINFDINLLGDCDAVVAELAKQAGWKLEHEMLPKNQTTEVQPIEHLEATYSVKVLEPASTNGQVGTTNGVSQTSSFTSAAAAAATTNGHTTVPKAEPNGEATTS